LNVEDLAMTMILTCLTKGFVIQTSDRRISTVVDRKVQWYDDISNKALVYKKQFVFAYTGQAKIPVKKDGQNVLMSTIDWAAEQLKNGRNLDEAVNNLKFRATELMNSNRIRKLHEYKRRIAFVGVGFKEVEKGGKRIRIPLRIMVENFIDDDGSMMDQPRDEFKDHWDELKKGDVALYVAGTPLAEKKRIEITRFLKRLVQHGASPENIGVVLTRTIQEVAEAMPEDERTVGKNLMCICVPQAYSDKEEEGMLVPITGGIPVEIAANSDGSLIFKPMENAPLADRIRFMPSFDPNSSGLDAPRSFDSSKSLVFDSPRFAYIAEDNKSQPYHSPVYVRPGQIVPTITLGEMSVTYTPNAPILKP
jgi:hypothetical protein